MAINEGTIGAIVVRAFGAQIVKNGGLLVISQSEWEDELLNDKQVSIEYDEKQGAVIFTLEKMESE